MLSQLHYSSPDRGRRSLPPGRYFRMLLVGYFEGIDSERGIEWWCADSLGLRQFLLLASLAGVPDYSWLPRTRSRLPKELHEHGRDNVQKRHLIHIAAYNLGLIMRLLTGFGYPNALGGWEPGCSGARCTSLPITRPLARARTPEPSLVAAVVFVIGHENRCNLQFRNTLLARFIHEGNFAAAIERG